MPKTYIRLSAGERPCLMSCKLFVFLLVQIGMEMNCSQQKSQISKDKELLDKRNKTW